ncbi:MAG TPA: hypothetical protein VMI94_21545 [Bryobacteraceae bacterium]|nr:hypothetical protein [Bryobacteraceae bacterium]
MTPPDAMTWITYVLNALQADIVREAAAADEYLRLARLLRQSCDPLSRHQIATCAANALSNATALAAEIVALGGVPPSVPPAPKGTPKTAREHLTDVRSALAHYRGRLAMARRFGLPRLQELFRNIILRHERDLNANCSSH